MRKAGARRAGCARRHPEVTRPERIALPPFRPKRVPAKAGTQSRRRNWIPAFAGTSCASINRHNPNDP
ncbi:hypothetical protein AI27_08670 [Sphingomonas sp. BHC-A]|nr:hypothetical protein AI27_08670 [Sphingomonas sp. BHC-A]